MAKAFEGFLAEVAFDLLSNLIEFAVIVVNGQQESFR